MGLRCPPGTVARLGSRTATTTTALVYWADMDKADSLRVGRVLRVFNEYVRPARQGLAHRLEVGAYHVHGEPVPAETAFAATFEDFQVGEAWGPAWDTTWFRLRGSLPAEWCGREVHLRFAIGNAGETGFGAEALLYRDGQPVQGLSPNHRSYPLTGRAEGGETVELYVEAAANPPSPFGANPWPLLLADPDGVPLFTLARADLVTVDPAFESFFHDFRVAVELLMELPAAEPRRARLLAGLERAANRLALPDVAGTWPDAAGVVHELLAERASPSAHRVSATGHAHLDTAWLWPLRETIRKCARTFSTVLALMDRYPEYHFVVSQAQHLAWMRDHYPGLWARLLVRIAEGRVEPTGSMWVEADCNIPSGESLVRQIVHGKRFYLDELGLETEDVWLPDVFGYSAALPQIMRLGGVRRFLTQKLSWNQYNDMPHHSFYWEGIDGSRVFTHFPPADTYGGQMSVRELRHSVDNFRDHEHSNRSLYLFGYSDGGGGPTDAMLESARRLADSEGLPRLTMESAKAFFDRAESEIVDPAVWSGELYLEHHRGTYTTQGATKQGNRRGEMALRDAELWASLDGDPIPGPRAVCARGARSSSTSSTTSSRARASTGSTRTPDGTTPRSSGGPRRSPGRLSPGWPPASTPAEPPIRWWCGTPSPTPVPAWWRRRCPTGPQPCGTSTAPPHRSRWWTRGERCSSPPCRRAATASTTWWPPRPTAPRPTPGPARAMWRTSTCEWSSTTTG